MTPTERVAIEAIALHPGLPEHARALLTRLIGAPRASRHIPHSLRHRVLARDGLICGGRTIAKNLRVTHARCNLQKGARAS